MRLKVTVREGRKSQSQELTVYVGLMLALLPYIFSFFKNLSETKVRPPFQLKSTPYMFSYSSFDAFGKHWLVLSWVTLAEENVLEGINVLADCLLYIGAFMSTNGF